MNNVVWYIPENYRQELIAKGYDYIAMHKDSRAVTAFRKKSVVDGRFVVCPGVTIKMRGDRDYVVLSLQSRAND